MTFIPVPYMELCWMGVRALDDQMYWLASDYRISQDVGFSQSPGHPGMAVDPKDDSWYNPSEDLGLNKQWE